MRRNATAFIHPNFWETKRYSDESYDEYQEDDHNSTYGYCFLRCSFLHFLPSLFIRLNKMESL